MLRALTHDGLIFDFALNVVAGGADEFAGACFSPDTQVPYRNMQANGGSRSRSGSVAARADVVAV
jgi:secreted PhoX family phosphatase